MFPQLLLPPPVQVILRQEMGARYDHTATVFGSEPNFRMVVMFGGKRSLLSEPIAETNLLHLGEYIYHTHSNLRNSIGGSSLEHNMLREQKPWLS